MMPPVRTHTSDIDLRQPGNHGRPSVDAPCLAISYYPAVIAEAAVENTLLTSVPRVVKIVIAATLMRKTRSAYSTKSCPSSSDHSLRKVCIMVFLS